MNFNKYKELMRDGINLDSLEMTHPSLYQYWCGLENTLAKKVSHSNANTFWSDMHLLLTVDSKLVLIRDLISEEFSDEEIIDMVNQDYYHFYKELCGYNLGQKPHNSIMFLELNDN